MIISTLNDFGDLKFYRDFGGHGRKKRMNKVKKNMFIIISFITSFIVSTCEVAYLKLWSSSTSKMWRLAPLTGVVGNNFNQSMEQVTLPSSH